jgi:hypothetical protein
MIHSHRSRSGGPGGIARLLAPSLAALALVPTIAAQEPAALATRLAGMTAVTGYEQEMVDTLLTLVPGARRDRGGSAVLVLGQGTPRRLVVCPIDEPGYIVGGVRVDGWLTLRRVAGRGTGPLFDQQLEGQPVTIFARRGAVPGVVAVKSVHLTRGRDADSAPFTVDNAVVDVGARTAAEAAALGVAVLAPVALAKRPMRYGDGFLAAPSAGNRAACAALVFAAREARADRGTVVVGFVVQENLTRSGLLTLAHAQGPFDETVIVGGGAGPFGAIGVAGDSLLERLAPRLGRVVLWRLPTRYGGTPVETVALADAAAAAGKLRTWIGGGS